jgi:hypothetical protein
MHGLCQSGLAGWKLKKTGSCSTVSLQRASTALAQEAGQILPWPDFGATVQKIALLK